MIPFHCFKASNKSKRLPWDANIVRHMPNAHEHDTALAPGRDHVSQHDNDRHSPVHCHHHQHCHHQHHHHQGEAEP